MEDPIKFSKDLIKGRIAETLFEQMLRDAESFTILEFGYEKVLPELAHRLKDTNEEETMKIIRRAPDFAVIDNVTHEVFLIEVKYRMHPSEATMLKDAQKVQEYWKPAYLFVATPFGFYFGKAIDVVNSGGKIMPFSHPRVAVELQDRYKQLLNEVIPPTGAADSEEL